MFGQISRREESLGGVPVVEIEGRGGGGILVMKEQLQNVSSTSLMRVFYHNWLICLYMKRNLLIVACYTVIVFKLCKFNVNL